MFDMKVIRKIGKVFLQNKINLTAIDGTGFDSWQRNRHYEKRIEETHMPYAKVDLFIDVKQRKIINFNLTMKREHDAEPLHEIVRNKGGKLYAPVRKRNKRSLKQKPKGKEA